MAHDAAQGDGVDAALEGAAEGEVHVLAAVAVSGIETTDTREKMPVNEQAGAGDGRGAPPRKGRGQVGSEGEDAVVLGLALEVDDDAGVVDGAGGEGALHVADHAGARAEATGEDEHRLKPAREQREVVVEEGEIFAAREGGAGVIGGSVAPIFRLEDNANLGGSGGEGGEPVASAVGATVVHEDDLVVEGGGRGGLERPPHGLRERQAIVEGDDTGEFHGVGRAMGAG